jgi:hypothetical protein
MLASAVPFDRCGFSALEHLDVSLCLRGKSKVFAGNVFTISSGQITFVGYRRLRVKDEREESLRDVKF